MPMAPMICSFARNGMASHTSGALMPSVTDGHKERGRGSEIGAPAALRAAQRELTALGHVRRLRG